MILWDELSSEAVGASNILMATDDLRILEIVEKKGLKQYLQTQIYLLVLIDLKQQYN